MKKQPLTTLSQMKNNRTAMIHQPRLLTMYDIIGGRARDAGVQS